MYKSALRMIKSHLQMILVDLQRIRYVSGAAKKIPAGFAKYRAWSRRS
jgi:hypothetical protein